MVHLILSILHLLKRGNRHIDESKIIINEFPQSSVFYSLRESNSETMARRGNENSKDLAH